MNAQTFLSSLPPAGRRSVMIERDQDVFDIMNLISYAHKKNAGLYDKICMSFWGGDLYSSCESLWKFCKRNFPYHIQDEDYQSVRSPQRIIEAGKNDCKDFASFIGGVCGGWQRSGIDVEWFYRYTCYKLFSSTPTHVFIVVLDEEGEEIWIDPVLDQFDEHRPYTVAYDRKVRTPAASIGYLRRYISGGQDSAIGYESRYISATPATGMGTGQSVQLVGKTIMVVGPELAALTGPAAPFVAAGAVVVGAMMTAIGSLLNNWTTSTGQRWLTQLYQLMVLGQSGVTSDNKVDERYTLPAQTWFALVLGVPIYDRYRFNAIKQSVNAYLNFPDTKDVDLPSASHAYDIAQTMSFSAPPGGWKNFPPANVKVIGPAASTTPATVAVSPSGQLVPLTQPGSSNTLLWLLIGGGVILLVLK